MRQASVIAAMVAVLAAAAPPAEAQWGPPGMTPDDVLVQRADGVVTGPANPYTPPPCVAGEPFADVTCSTFYDAWIEQFARDGITAGCGGGNYCPNESVTRAQMAVFIEAAMRGTTYWSPGDLGNGAGNTGLGANRLYYNTSGYSNTAVGFSSLYENTTGYYNTGLGAASLYGQTTGHDNTAVGVSSLSGNGTGSYNTAIGSGANVDSSGRVNATAIGYGAIVDASYKVRIGNDQVTSIGGHVGWTNFSDIRGKTDIAALDLGLDFVMALRPVSFKLKQGNGRTDMGFIAQDIETLLGDGYNVLGIGGDRNRTLALRYTDFISPLVKAVQEQQAQIESQKAAIESLTRRLERLEGAATSGSGSR